MEGKNQQGVIQLVQVDEDGGSELISDVFLGGSFVQAVEIIPPVNKNGSNSAKDPSPHGENTPSNDEKNPNISKDNHQQEESSGEEQDQSKYLLSEAFSLCPV